MSSDSDEPATAARTSSGCTDVGLAARSLRDPSTCMCAQLTDTHTSAIRSTVQSSEMTFL